VFLSVGNDGKPAFLPTRDASCPYCHRRMQLHGEIQYPQPVRCVVCNGVFILDRPPDLVTLNAFWKEDS
jgi:hypothetical protein